MRWKALFCAVVGHHWVQPPDEHEVHPVFECTRCGRQQEFTPGGSRAGFESRLGVEADANRVGGTQIFRGRR